MEHFPSCLNNPLLWVTLSPKGEGEERWSKKKKQSETKKTGTEQALIDKSEGNGEKKEGRRMEKVPLCLNLIRNGLCLYTPAREWRCD